MFSSLAKNPQRLFKKKKKEQKTYGQRGGKKKKMTILNIYKESGVIVVFKIKAKMSK